MGIGKILGGGAKKPADRAGQPAGTFTEESLPAPARTVIARYNAELLTEDEANGRTEVADRTAINWLPLARAAVEYANNTGVAEDFIFGGAIAGTREETFTPMHFDRKKLDDFAADIIEAVRAEKAQDRDVPI